MLWGNDGATFPFLSASSTLNLDIIGIIGIIGIISIILLKLFQSLFDKTTPK